MSGSQKHNDRTSRRTPTGIRLIGSAHWLTEGTEIRGCMSESQLMATQEVPSAHVPLVHKFTEQNTRTQAQLMTGDTKKRQDIQVRHLGDEFSTSPVFQFFPSVTKGPHGSGEKEQIHQHPTVLSLLRGAVNAKARDRFGAAAQFMGRNEV